MATGARVIGWNGTSRRRGPRFPLQAVLDVTVLRSGIPDTVPGRALNACERGIAAMLAQELVPGEAVAIEVQLSDVEAPLRTRAIVRYQDKLCSGLEFMGLSANQRAAIRRWAKEAETEIKVSANPAFATAAKSGNASEGARKTLSSGARPGKKRFRVGWTILLVFVVFAVAVLWWHWNRGWEELESGLKSPEITSSEKPQVQVPGDADQSGHPHRAQWGASRARRGDDGGRRFGRGDDGRGGV